MEPRPEWLRTRVLRGSQSCAAYNEFACEYVAETDSSAANDPATLASDWALEIGEEFNVSVDHLYESSPGSPHLARTAVLALARLNTSLSQDEIAAHFGLSSRSAVAQAGSRLRGVVERRPVLGHRLVRSGLPL